MNINLIKEAIKNHSVISFDIFDTAVVRPYVCPADIFQHMAQTHNIDNWKEIRCQAEYIAWNKYRSDVKEDITLNEIYAEIPSSCQYLKDEEILFEQDQVLVNPQIYEIYQYALKQHKKIIFTSDMYLPKNIIANILKKCGYSDYTNLYVSCEHGKLKKTGSLFRFLINDMNVSASDILHIGDNTESDIKSANACGLATFYYTPILQQYYNSYPYLRKISQFCKSNLSLSAIVMLCAIRHVNDKMFSANYWYSIGYRFAGPLCHTFLAWIYDLLPANINDLIFIARDGYLLEKVAKKCYFSSLRLHYIYAPRSLMLLCSLNYSKEGRFALEHTKTIIEYYKDKSKELLNIPVITSGEEGVSFIEKHRALFEKLATNETLEYKDYINDFNLGENVALVDSVSKFCSAQVFLSKLFPQKNFYGLYYAIQSNGVHLNRALSYKKRRPYSVDLAFVEFLLSSPEPPILNVVNKTPAYKKNISEEERRRQKAFMEIEKGTMAFAEDWSKIFSKHPLSGQTTDITEYLMNFIKNPLSLDKEEFAKVLFAYDPQHKAFAPIFPSWYSGDKAPKPEAWSHYGSLLGIPIYKKTSDRKQEFYIGKYIPIFLIKTTGDRSYKYKLFKFIPVWRTRWTKRW